MLLFICIIVMSRLKMHFLKWKKKLENGDLKAKRQRSLSSLGLQSLSFVHSLINTTPTSWNRTDQLQIICRPTWWAFHSNCFLVDRVHYIAELIEEIRNFWAARLIHCGYITAARFTWISVLPVIQVANDSSVKDCAIHWYFCNRKDTKK